MTVASAALGGAAALLFLLAPRAAPALALPAVLGVAAFAGFLLLPVAALSRPEKDRTRGALAAGAAGALAGAGPAAAAAFALGGADAAGLARGAATVLLLAVLGALLTRLPARAAVLAALLACVIPPAARFIALAVYGEDRRALAFCSPLEVASRALGRARPLAPEPPVGATIAAPHLRSLTNGRFRPGVPTPVEVGGEAGPGALLLAGGEPPFAAAPLEPAPDGHARAIVHPIFHDARATLGSVLAKAADDIDWKPLRGAARLTVGANEALPPLGDLLAFDEVEKSPADDRVEAFRALAADRALGPRADDPSLDPARYESDDPPRVPAALRRRLALAAGVGALLVIAAAALPRRAGALAGPLVGLLSGAAILLLAPSARAIASERALLYLLPGSSVGAEIRAIEVEAREAPALADFALPRDFESLLPVLYRRPEPVRYAIVADPARGPRTVGLALAPGERRIFDAVKPRRLAGPVEVRAGPGGALRVLNRTGRDFEEAIFLGAHGALLLGRLDDGAPLEIPRGKESLSFFELGEALERRGDEGRALRRTLGRLFERRRAPEGGRLVLLSRAETPVVEGLPVEGHAAVTIVTIPGR